jgi:hypothetical protein
MVDALGWFEWFEEGNSNFVYGLVQAFARFLKKKSGVCEMMMCDDDDVNYGPCCFN